MATNNFYEIILMLLRTNSDLMEYATTPERWATHIYEAQETQNLGRLPSVKAQIKSFSGDEKQATANPRTFACSLNLITPKNWKDEEIALFATQVRMAITNVECDVAPNWLTVKFSISEIERHSRFSKIELNLTVAGI